MEQALEALNTLTSEEWLHVEFVQRERQFELLRKIKRDVRNIDNWYKLFEYLLLENVAYRKTDALSNLVKIVLESLLSTNEKTEYRKNKYFIAMWLLRAKLLEMSGKSTGARSVYTHLQRVDYGVKNYTYYEQYATFEYLARRKEEAKRILSVGEQENVLSRRDVDKIQQNWNNLQKDSETKKDERVGLSRDKFSASESKFRNKEDVRSNTFEQEVPQRPDYRSDKPYQSTPIDYKSSTRTAASTHGKGNTDTKSVFGKPERVPRENKENQDGKPAAESFSHIIGWEPNRHRKGEINSSAVQDVSNKMTSKNMIQDSPSSDTSTSPLSEESPTTQHENNPYLRVLSRNKCVVVAGKTYLVLEEIGRGGSSKVYRILAPDLQIYALKKIKLKQLDQSNIQQYENEISLLKKLQGKEHIIRLVAADTDLKQKVIHVIMEHGEIDLCRRLKEMRQANDINENFIRIIWQQMLEAVHTIHDERIVHGDLKPANFLFVNGALKLIDFGIAKVIANDTTNIVRESQVGTVNFMSPEAIVGTSPGSNFGRTSNMKVSRASDIWSLGCILYQMTYGNPPFGSLSNIIQKLRSIVDTNYEIEFPECKNKFLKDTIIGCLQRDPLQRATIDGENGLLAHPFLNPPTSTSTGSIPINALERAVDQLYTMGAKSSKSLSSDKRRQLARSIKSQLEKLAIP